MRAANIHARLKDMVIMSRYFAQDIDIGLTKDEHLNKFKDQSLKSELLKDKKSFLSLFSK